MNNFSRIVNESGAGIGHYCGQIFKREEEKNGGYAGIGRECLAHRLNWFRYAAKTGAGVYAPNQTHAAAFHKAMEEKKVTHSYISAYEEWLLGKCKWD